MTKYKIKYLEKDKYCVIKITEDLDDVYIERVFEGNINECSKFVEWKN